MLTRGGMLADTSVASLSSGGKTGNMVRDSAVTFGASGARGLVKGVISRRTTINRVVAAGSAEAKAFLERHPFRSGRPDRRRGAPAPTVPPRFQPVSRACKIDGS
jgi:hypothetical protein